MEFKSLKNLETSFNFLKKFSLFAVGASFVTVVAVIVFSYNLVQKEREKIYVLDEGKTLILALSQDATTNRPAEAREHMRRFHELFYTLAPEASAIEGNINRALKLGDKSIYYLYLDMAEKGYYNRIISGNVLQRINVDSVVINFAQHPYEVKTYSRQFLTRSGKTKERILISECTLRNTVRSEDNPQGFLIEKYRVVENRDNVEESRFSKMLSQEE